MDRLNKPNVGIQELLEHRNKGSTGSGIRIFNFTSGQSLIGILYEETEDSFLIYFPARLMGLGDSRMVELYVTVPFIRQFKTAISALIPVYGEFESVYVKYLIDNLESICPEFVDTYPDYLPNLKRRYEEIKPTEPVKLVESAGEEETETVIISESTSKYKH